jgi:hypothetical protein
MKINCRRYSTKQHANLLDRAHRRPTLRILWPVIVAVAAVGSGGCASLGAKPWEHDLLAEQVMQLDPYPLETAIDDHIYFSKEASSGGRSFAGGGCGCN